MERTKRARMTFLVYLATEVKGSLNNPFPLISHTDFSYTQFFVRRVQLTKYFFHDKTNETMIICSWFRNILIRRLTWLCIRRFFWDNSEGSLRCCLLGTFKRATSLKFSPVSFIIIQSFFLISNISICPDIDECSVFPSICDINAICRNSEGSYLYSCKVTLNLLKV